MRTRGRVVLWLFVMFSTAVLCAAPLCAQVITGVFGTITSQTGLGVPRAKVTLKNLGTGVAVTTISNATGYYVFNLLSPGHYSVAIEANGFKKMVYPEFVLAAGESAREDGKLAIGSADETVTVMAAPSPVSISSLPPPEVSWEEYLRKAAVPREVIDGYLRGPSWAQFDSETGYILRNSLMPWGIDHSSTIETTLPNGARTTMLYAGRKVRINSYGDSFTECAQVSDGETWQEYLAGHIGEPIRNFGVGGYGVYQAYRRMLREEKTDHGAEYVIFTICCDDPTRSLVRSRYTTIYPWWNNEAGVWFHANFWANLEMDLKTGRLVEKEQLLPSKESLYSMNDPQWMADHLRDDLALQLSAYSSGFIRELDREKVTRLASLLNFRFDWSLSEANAPGIQPGDHHPTPMQTQVYALFNRYGQRATLFILDKARDFARQNNKKLLVILSNTTAFDERVVRDDQEILDYLAKERFDYVDINQSFRDEFRNSKTTMTFSEFMAQYLVNGRGHLNPKGNHFVAFALKDKVVSMLDPKPVPYQQPDAMQISFKGYLHGGGFN